jgi:hypothetical protein
MRWMLERRRRGCEGGSARPGAARRPAGRHAAPLRLLAGQIRPHAAHAQRRHHHLGPRAQRHSPWQRCACPGRRARGRADCVPCRRDAAAVPTHPAAVPHRQGAGGGAQHTAAHDERYAVVFGAPKASRPPPRRCPRRCTRRRRRRRQSPRPLTTSPCASHLGRNRTSPLPAAVQPVARRTGPPPQQAGQAGDERARAHRRRRRRRRPRKCCGRPWGRRACRPQPQWGRARSARQEGMTVTLRSHGEVAALHGRQRAEWVKDGREGGRRAGGRRRGVHAAAHARRTHPLRECTHTRPRTPHHPLPVPTLKGPAGAPRAAGCAPCTRAAIPPPPPNALARPRPRALNTRPPSPALPCRSHAQAGRRCPAPSAPRSA